MVPPAPGLFAITTGWPSPLAMNSSTVRAAMSVPLPTLQGTTSFTGLLRKVWAHAQQPAVTIFPAAGHHHTVDVGQCGLKHHAGHGVVHRLHIQQVGAHQHQISLFAGLYRADAVPLVQHAGTLHRHPRQCL